MLADVLVILAGFALILLLGEVVIRNAMDLARHYRLSGTFIGLTVLSIGTSIPEIFTHVLGSVAILRRPEDMHTISSLLIGTNIGSDIFQQNFVLPLIGLIGTVLVRRDRLFSEVGALIAASLLIWVLGLGGVVTRFDGLLLLVAYALYLVWLARTDGSGEEIGAAITLGNGRRFQAMALLLLSFAVMAVVTDRVVVAATELVAQLPISASFFGVIFLGVASAMPELSTALISLSKGERGVSAGILIGSNITNPLLGIGLGAVISTYTVAEVIVLYDLPIKVLTAGVLFWFLWTREELERWECLALIGGFLLYLLLRVVLFPSDL